MGELSENIFLIELSLGSINFNPVPSQLAAIILYSEIAFMGPSYLHVLYYYFTIFIVSGVSITSNIKSHVDVTAAN